MLMVCSSYCYLNHLLLVIDRVAGEIGQIRLVASVCVHVSVRLSSDSLLFEPFDLDLSMRVDLDLGKHNIGTCLRINLKTTSVNRAPGFWYHALKC